MIQRYMPTVVSDKDKKLQNKRESSLVMSRAAVAEIMLFFF